MKRIILYSFLAVFMFSACRKSDNAKLPDGIESVPLPKLTRVAEADLIISALEPATFHGKFIVDLNFPNGVKPTKMDVVIMKNGDTKNVKTFKSDISVFPTTVDISGEELLSLFGNTIVLGDKFDIGVNVTTNSGKTYPAFPAVGVGYGSNVSNQPGASPAIKYEAVCEFDAAAYAGKFQVIVDEWADYAPGDIIDVTVINDHQVSFEYPADDARPIIVNINTASNETSVVKQVMGNYGAAYGNFSVESVTGSADNFVAPCDGILSVKLNFTTPTANYGSALIKLKKVN